MKTVYIAVQKSNRDNVWTQGYMPSREEIFDSRFDWYKVRARTNNQGYILFLNGEADKI